MPRAAGGAGKGKSDAPSPQRGRGKDAQAEKPDRSGDEAPKAAREKPASTREKPASARTSSPRAKPAPTGKDGRKAGAVAPSRDRTPSGRPSWPRRTGKPAAPTSNPHPAHAAAAASGKAQQRIAKLLARAGIASRREVERMIAEGRVALNGAPIDTPATLLPSLHGVTVDGNPVDAPAPARLFLFYKPVGYLTTERDPRGRPTIYDRLPADLPRLMPVGRLDMNTEGLLLLTTDGELKRQMELPATGVERSYRARAFGEVSQAQLEELVMGVEIDGVRYGRIDANLERRTGRNQWVEMTITEGKNREVRRVLEHLGLQVNRLIRTRYGPFVLGEMAPGEIGEVRQHDLIVFRKTLKGAKTR